MRQLLATDYQSTGAALWFLILIGAMSAASYRIGRLVVLDSLWEGWRDRLLGWLTGGPKLSVVKLKLSELFTCPFCVTGWTSLAVVIAVDVFHHLPLIGLQWLAVWVGALIFWGLIDSDEGPRMEHGKK